MSQTMPSLDDQQLIALACNNDPHAIEQLLHRYQKKTLSLVRHYVNTQADAQDITQEVLLKLYRSLASFQFDANFTTWHYRIVMNTISSYFRQSNQRLFSHAMNYDDFNESTLNIPKVSSPQQLLINEQTLQSRLKRFSKLPSKVRDMLLQIAINGDSYEYVAQQLNCPIGTIRSRIHRARLFLNNVKD